MTFVLRSGKETVNAVQPASILIFEVDSPTGALFQSIEIRTRWSEIAPGGVSAPEDGVAVIHGSDVTLKVEVVFPLGYISTHRVSGPYESIIGSAVTLPPSTNIPGVVVVLLEGYDCAGMLFEAGCYLELSARPQGSDEITLPVGITSMCLIHHIIPFPSKQLVHSLCFVWHINCSSLC